MQTPTVIGTALAGLITINMLAPFEPKNPEAVKAAAAWALSNNQHSPTVEGEDQEIAFDSSVVNANYPTSVPAGFVKRQINADIVGSGPVANWQSYQPEMQAAGGTHFEVAPDGTTLIEVPN